jgi:hypothetical protein
MHHSLRLSAFLSLLVLLPFTSQVAGLSNFDDDRKVPVILGVMSRCPDAQLCESVFDDVLKQVGVKMSLEMTYIARYAVSSQSTPYYGAQSP